MGEPVFIADGGRPTKNFCSLRCCSLTSYECITSKACCGRTTRIQVIIVAVGLLGIDVYHRSEIRSEVRTLHGSQAGRGATVSRPGRGMAQTGSGTSSLCEMKPDPIARADASPTRPYPAGSESPPYPRQRQLGQHAVLTLPRYSLGAFLA